VSDALLLAEQQRDLPMRCCVAVVGLLESLRGEREQLGDCGQVPIRGRGVDVAEEGR
jgi:hypothetical protein